jgi:hypothetical protein
LFNTITSFFRISNVNSPSSKRLPIAFALWVMVTASLLAVGCQRRAYTELYVERMAGEIRELEDRIFEYDAAYRQTEDELDIIRSENESLRTQLAQQASPPQRSGNSPLREKLEDLRDSRSNSPSRSNAPSKPIPATPILPRSDSISPPDLNDSPKTESKPESKVVSPPATNKTSPAKPNIPLPTEPLDLEPPEIELGVPGSIETLPFKLPESGAIPNVPAPGSLLPPPLTNGPTTQNQSYTGGVVGVATNTPNETQTIRLPPSLDPDDVESNQIVLPMFVKKESRRGNVSGSNAGEDVVPASATVGSNVSNGNSVSQLNPGIGVIGKPDWIPQPQDTRVIEIAFHPSLCRGANRESDPNEDGLRLVLQPKNKEGDFLPQFAAMTMVVVDPGRPEGESKIGRWTWTAEELQQALEPIGNSQGFHVAVHWQTKRPLAKTVHVHVRYEMPDGRRLVNERVIELYTPSLGSDAWTPRVPK